MARCYSSFGEVPQERRTGRARRNPPSVELPLATAGSLNPRGADGQPLHVNTLPAPVVNFFRYGGPMYRFREAVKDLCSLNASRMRQTRRAHEVLSWGRAAATVGDMLSHMADVDRITPPESDETPPGFTERVQRLRQAVDNPPYVLNPLAACNPGLLDRVHAQAQTVREAMKGSDITNEINETVRALGAGARGVAWSIAVIERVGKITTLALLEVEATSRQMDLANDLQGVIEDNDDHLLKTLKGYTGNGKKALSLASHVVGVMARARLYHLVDSPGDADGAALTAIRYWASWLSGVDADDVHARLRTGDAAQVAHVRRDIKRAIGLSGPSADLVVSRLAKGLGYVQAFFTIALFFQDPNPTSRLAETRQRLSTGQALTTIGGGIFTIIGAEATQATGEGFARMFETTMRVMRQESFHMAGGVLRAAGKALSFASAIVSIIEGVNRFSTGWRDGTNVDVYEVANGALQVTSGLLTIVGLLCVSPLTATAGAVVGLVAVGVSVAQPDEPVAKQALESLLVSLHGRRRIAEALGIDATLINELLEYTQGVSANGAGFSEPWGYWVARESHINRPAQGAIAEAWRMALRDVGFNANQSRQLLGS